MRYSHGADPLVLDRIAAGLRQDAEELDGLRRLAAQAVTAMREGWDGPDYARLAGEWSDSCQPRLDHAHAALLACARRLVDQADQQRRASGEPVGTTGPGVPGSGSPLAPGPSHPQGPGEDDPWTWTWKHDRDDPFDLRTTRHRAHDTGDGRWTHDRSQESSEDGHRREWSRQDQHHWNRDGHAPREHPDGEEKRTGPDVRADLWKKQEAHEVRLAGWESEDGKDAVQLLSAGEKADAHAGFEHGTAAVGASATAGAYLASAKGDVSLGGRAGRIGARGEAYVGAQASANAGLGLGLSGVSAHTGAEAFVGGKAETQVYGSSHGLGGGVGGEVSYGLGAHADVDASLSLDHVGLSMDLGATLGVGGGFSVDVDVDPGEVLDSVEGWF